jgi:hypothetical protein
MQHEWGQYRETYLQNVTPQYRLFELMELNFLKKNNSDHEKNFGATKCSQFENEKTTFRALKRAIKVDLLLIGCCYINLYRSRHTNSKNPY